MTTTRSLDWTWGILVTLTLVGIAIGGAATPGFWVTVGVAALAAFKGRLLIDQYMELGTAHPTIRRLVRLWGLFVPGLMILIYLFGPQIAQLTRLSRG